MRDDACDHAQKQLDLWATRNPNPFAPDRQDRSVGQFLRVVLQPDEVYFWATHQGAELDLLLLKDGRRLGVEAKHADAPVLTRSMHIALEDLKLEHLAVLYPGTQRYSLSDQVTVMPLTTLANGDMDSLFPRRRSR